MVGYTKDMFTLEGLGLSPKTQVESCLKDETTFNVVFFTEQGSSKWVVAHSLGLNINRKVAKKI